MLLSTVTTPNVNKQSFFPSLSVSKAKQKEAEGPLIRFLPLPPLLRCVVNIIYPISYNITLSIPKYIQTPLVSLFDLVDSECVSQ